MRMTQQINIPIVPLAHFDGLELPTYETTGSAGMDVRAAVPDGEPMTLAPGERDMVPTGITMAIPHGYCLLYTSPSPRDA